MKKFIALLFVLYIQTSTITAAVPNLEYSIPFNYGSFTYTDYVLLKAENTSEYDYGVVYYANHQSSYDTTECNRDLNCKESYCNTNGWSLGYASYPDNRGASGYLLQYNDWCGYVPHFSRRHNKTTGVWSNSYFENNNDYLRADPTIPFSQSTITTFPLKIFNYHPVNDDFLGDYELRVVTFGLVVLVANSNTVIAPSSLGMPLNGLMKNRTLLLKFGGAWTFGECPTGVYKKHAGIDLKATTNEAVYATHYGTVRAIYTGNHAQWADAIIIESANGQFTTVSWHVIKYGNLKIGDYVKKGQRIASVANLGKNTHFHFGIRLAPYNSKTSLAGALPNKNCGGYLAFPERFLNPTQITYK